MPCPEDLQQLFISKTPADVKAEAHTMLSESCTDSMPNISLGHANCRFEDLHPEHFLKLMVVTEDIMRKQEASRSSLRDMIRLSIKGMIFTCLKGQRMNGTVREKQANGRTENFDKEMKTNATVASAGDIADLQELVSDYQNTTKFFTKKNKVYCAPVREFTQAPCKYSVLRKKLTTSTPSAMVAMLSSPLL